MDTIKIRSKYLWRRQGEEIGGVRVVVPPMRETANDVALLTGFLEG